MQLVAYRNTERSARPLVTEERRAANQLAFMERRRVELSEELKTLVKDREKAIKRLAYDRKMAQLELKAERERIARELAEAIAEHRRRGEEMARDMAVLNGNVQMYHVAKRICRVFGISMVALIADRRDKSTVLARHAFCYWACRLTPKSLPQIGRFLGGRDHTTIIHGRAAYVVKRAKMGRTLRVVR